MRKFKNPAILVRAGVFVLTSLLWTNNGSNHHLFHYSRVMAVSVCSFWRLNLLVLTRAWRLRLVPPPSHFLLTRDYPKERAGLVLPTISVMFDHVGGPGEGATVTAVALAPNMTGWARRGSHFWQEIEGADGEERTLCTVGQQQNWLVFVRREDADLKAVQAAIHGIIISFGILSFLAFVMIPAACVLLWNTVVLLFPL